MTGTLDAMVSIDRPALNREFIAREALALVEDDGLEGLSMRKLGARLGVEAMSLYHYVANKADLLDAALEQIYLEIDIPDHDDPLQWEATARAGLISFHTVLARRPRAMTLFATRPGVSPGALAVFRKAHQVFERAGLTPVDAHSALHVAVSYVLGQVAFNRPKETEELERRTAQAVGDPELLKFIEAAQVHDADTAFEIGLDAVLLGIGQRFNLPRR